jgi:hypothetical protein
MDNKNLRYAKLMKAMGLPEQQAPVRPTQESETMAPERIEALTGTEHPDLQQKRRMQMLIDAKISQLEGSDDPNALESLNFWKQKRDSLAAD